MAISNGKTTSSVYYNGPLTIHVPVQLTELGIKTHLCHMFTNIYYSHVCIASCAGASINNKHTCFTDIEL